MSCRAVATTSSLELQNELILSCVASLSNTRRLVDNRYREKCRWLAFGCATVVHTLGLGGRLSNFGDNMQLWSNSSTRFRFINS